MGPLEAAKLLLDSLHKELESCDSDASGNEYILRHAEINKTIDKIDSYINVVFNIEDYIEKTKEYLSALKDQLEDYLNYPDNLPYYRYLGNISWDSLSEIDQEKERSMLSLADIKESPKKVNKQKGVRIEEYDGTSIFPVYLPKVKNLGDIPPMFYYYEGDAENKPGIYISPSENFYIRVSLVDVFKYEDTTKPNSGTRCKFGTRERCTAAKKQNKYISGNNSADSSINSSCKFVHLNEDYCRIGHIERCAILTSFGKKQNFEYDIGVLNESDTKTMLMNAVPDLFYSFVWFNKNKFGTRVYSNLNKCE